MKVILNDYIEHLGERGETVVVKPGYARNFLLPKGLAYADTPGNRKRFEQEQHTWEEMDLQRTSAATQLASDLEGTRLVFERRAGEKDILFGSVNLADIARELADRGFELDRRRILLEHPIKELGRSAVVVHVHRDIKVTIPIQVVRPGEDPDAALPEFVAEGPLTVAEEAAEGAFDDEPVGATEPPVDEPAVE